MSTVYHSPRLSFASLAKLIAPAVVALGLFAASTGGASAVTCPDEAGSFNASFTVTSAPVDNVTCHIGSFDLWDSGNLNGTNSDAVALAGKAAFGSSFSFLEKDTASAGNPTNSAGILQISNFAQVVDPGQAPDTFTMDFSIIGAFTNLVIAINGSNQTSPRWVGFLLPDFSTGGTITLFAQNGLSHINLYGTVAAVPVPAGIALGVSALGLLGFMGWRRKKTTAA